MKGLPIIILLLAGFMNGDTTVDKSKLLGADYRLFQDTPAWGLAKAVEDEDTDKIKQEINRQKDLVDYPESRYGRTLLMMAVYNQNYRSVKSLLELGADPNKPDKENGESALMESVRLEGKSELNVPDPRYLSLLLLHGGNPNAVQNAPSAKNGKLRISILEMACLNGDLNYVKILVNAGAIINYKINEGFNPLNAAILSQNPDIVLYLLENGANFKIPMYTMITGEKVYILQGINTTWDIFAPGSYEYKKETEVKKWLSVHGVK